MDILKNEHTHVHTHVHTHLRTYTHTHTFNKSACKISENRVGKERGKIGKLSTTPAVPRWLVTYPSTEQIGPTVLNFGKEF